MTSQKFAPPFSKTPQGELAGKLDRLKDIIGEMDSALVAFSGGVDSTLLLSLASEDLGGKVVAVTANSEIFSRKEVSQAVKLAKEAGVKHRLVESGELNNENFLSNPSNRCYYCKKEIFSGLWKLAREEGCRYLLDGANAADLEDFRPGIQAVQELDIKSPLQEAGLTKEEIRELSRWYRLPTADKPSMACLASRIPYGRRIIKEELKQVEAAEEYLQERGTGQVRVRHYGEIARIEVMPEEMSRMLKDREKIVRKFKELGFVYVTLDLQGFRSGSMNETL